MLGFPRGAGRADQKAEGGACAGHVVEHGPGGALRPAMRDRAEPVSAAGSDELLRVAGIVVLLADGQADRDISRLGNARDAERIGHSVLAAESGAAPAAVVR